LKYLPHFYPFKSLQLSFDICCFSFVVYVRNKIVSTAIFVGRNTLLGYLLSKKWYMRVERENTLLFLNADLAILIIYVRYTVMWLIRLRLVGI
jgi:hypothetical protein